MNRKQFLLTSGVVLSGASLSLVLWKRAAATPPLQQPWFLAHLFDHDRLREIGVAYRSRTPAEDAVAELTRLLLNQPGSPRSFKDDATLGRQLQEVVVDDFAHGRIVIVDGWVLSVTEARQCALLSIASL